MQKVIIHAIPRKYPDEPWPEVAKRFVNDVTLLNDVIEVQKVPDTERYKLEEMQGIVGGLIDILGARNDTGMPVAMVINDEGRVDNLPVNLLATFLARDYGMISEEDSIAGDVLLAYDTGDELRPFTNAEYCLLRPSPMERLIECYMALWWNKDKF